MKNDPVEQIKKAVAILKKGGVLAFPTDTVYGLGAMADNPAAIRRIFEIKKRPLSLALPLLLSEAEEVDNVAVTIPELARCLIARFWPGALTVILKKAAWVPDVLTAGSSNVAVRVPAHPVPVALVRGMEMALVGTSANIHGRPSPVTSTEVKEQLADSVDFIIDGGQTPGGIESTVIDVTVVPPRILRQGAISIREIEKTTPLDKCP